MAGNAAGFSGLELPSSSPIFPLQSSFCYATLSLSLSLCFLA